jgi:hypothetical protein
VSWWAWATIGLLAYSGVVVLVVRACRWSARLSRDDGAPGARPALRPLTPAAPGPGSQV